jgi:hypothetical protein
MNNPIVPGTEGLVKHVSSHSHSSSVRYQDVTVSRVTKARVFAKASPEAREVEFRLDNLREYGEKSWRADELILDPAAIAKVRADLAAEQARKALEMRAQMAMADLRKLFEGYSLHSRTEAEIERLVALQLSFCTPASENAGPG